jgi:hypothetical protein
MVGVIVQGPHQAADQDEKADGQDDLFADADL